MGRLMVFYTIEKDTPIGTVTKEIAMISMIKVWSDVVLIERDMIYIKIENICDISDWKTYVVFEREAREF